MDEETRTEIRRLKEMLEMVVEYLGHLSEEVKALELRIKELEDRQANEQDNGE